MPGRLLMAALWILLASLNGFQLAGTLSSDSYISLQDEEYRLKVDPSADWTHEQIEAAVNEVAIWHGRYATLPVGWLALSNVAGLSLLLGLFLYQNKPTAAA